MTPEEFQTAEYKRGLDDGFKLAAKKYREARDGRAGVPEYGGALYTGTPVAELYVGKYSCEPGFKEVFYGY